MRKLFRLVFWVALVLGVIVGLARATAIRWWRVPHDAPFFTASLSPSIAPGDLILLWRLTKPGFGDLVMCPEPQDASRVVIGRLVGEARDDIAIVGANITVNGKAQSTEGNCAEGTFQEHDPETGVSIEQHCSLEAIGSVTHLRGEIPPRSHAPRDVKQTVPVGHVWLVSDNRLFPYDSRDFGPVPRESCTETVFFRLVGAGGYFDVKRRNQFIR
jgi:signal peptidase I